jgi:signal transduction histidine kinase/ActR/RegA family two-component response regulator
MKKYFYLIFVFLLLVTRGISMPDTSTDSLSRVIRQMPEKEKPAALQKAAFRFYQEYPEAAMNFAYQFEKLPDKQSTINRKIDFFKTLSAKFEEVNNYRYALLCLKIADSLETMQYRASQKVSKNNSGLPVAFYLFIFVLLTAVVWLIYLLSVSQKTVRKLQQAKEELQHLQNETARAEKEITEQLNIQTKDIQDKLETLRAEEVTLKTSLKKAEEANYLRNAFIANLGFDVRTPLSGIIGFANMLETELAVKGNRELYEYAANIEKSGSRLLKLLDNVIDLSSLESNTLVLKIKPVAPDRIIARVFEQFQPEAANKSLIFKSKTGDELRTVLADEKGLRKAITQIVDNAIKYTEKGFVTISATYSDETDTDIIEIKDNGPGISQEKQKHLFEPELLQESQNEGTGIGLKLSKKYVEMMKGSLFLESVPGKGTTVTLHLPCSEEAVVEEKPFAAGAVPEIEISTADELGELDIFVVEDDRMNRLILEKMLTTLGKVKLTVDGDDCLNTVDKEAAKGHFYQVMLFDINLPGDWDGIKLLKEIREKYPEYRKIPFIAQTAYAMSGDKDRLLKEGFDSYLAKPIDKNELITTIKQQLKIFGQNHGE